MSITFKKSLEDFMPIYYHFLDGYIDPEIGFTTPKVINFVKKLMNDIETDLETDEEEIGTFKTIDECFAAML